MKGYAQSQDVSLGIDGTYMGMAVSESVFKITTEHLYGDVKPAIIRAVHIVPFVVVFVVLLIGFIVLCWYGYRESLDSGCIFQETLKGIVSDSELQANLVAVLFLCSFTTIAIFIVDCISWAVENSGKLPSYFPKDGYDLLVISIIFSFASLITLIVGLVGFIIFLLYWKIKKRDKKHDKKHTIKSSYFFIPILLCCGSTLLMMSFHFPTILMAWSSDPFYASRIALYYGIAIFCLFISIKFAYNVSLTNNIYGQIVVRTLSVVGIFFFVCGVLVTILIFVAAIPVNNSIEESSDGITSIYNGAVVLIGSIIAYKIGWYYFGNSFSVDDALKQAMAEIKMTPFYCDENKYWKELPEEKRMTEIMKALIHHQLLARYYTIPSALNSVLTKACKARKLINVTTVEAATLTTTLAPHLCNAVGKDSENDSENKKNDSENKKNDSKNKKNDSENKKKDARTNALIDALYTIVLDAPNIDLKVLPIKEKKETLEMEVKEVLEVIDKSTTTLDENNKERVRKALEKALTP